MLVIISPKGGIIVTENGTAVNEPTVDAAVDDKARIAYFKAYITAMHEAIEQGADVRGYYAWSFMDNFGEGSIVTLIVSQVCAVGLLCRWWVSHLEHDNPF